MKSWKNWPYWVKGGIISVLAVAILVLLLTLLDNVLRAPNTEISIWGMLGMILFSWGYVIMPYGIPGPVALYTILINVLAYFLLGVILGWLYGKIKNRKNGVQNSNIGV